MNLVIVELTRHSVTLSSAEFFAHLLPPFVALSEFSNFNILPLPDFSLIPLAFHVLPIRTVAVLSPPFSYPSTLYDGTATLPLLLSRLISPTESATVFPICRSLFFLTSLLLSVITPKMSSCDLSLLLTRSQTCVIRRTDFTASCPRHCRLPQRSHVSLSESSVFSLRRDRLKAATRPSCQGTMSRSSTNDKVHYPSRA